MDNKTPAHNPITSHLLGMEWFVPLLDTEDQHLLVAVLRSCVTSGVYPTIENLKFWETKFVIKCLLKTMDKIANNTIKTNIQTDQLKNIVLLLDDHGNR